MSRDPTYPPLDVPKPVADGVWIVDARPIHAGGLQLPLRMTIIRLTNGDLLLHSPTQHSAILHDRIETLGPVRHFVAPSVGHWTFLRDWQRACPGATTWAVAGLRDRAQVRRAGIRVDVELGDAPPPAWAGEMDQVLVSGPVFKEVDLYHRPSRTLLVTDLVLNVEPSGVSPLMRPVARALGILAPNGKAPAYVRLLLAMNRASVSRAAARLVAFEPERVIITHGLWFSRDAPAKLRRSLAWALPVGGGAPAREAGFLPVPSGAGWLVLAAAIGAVGALVWRRRRRPPDGVRRPRLR